MFWKVPAVNSNTVYKQGNIIGELDQLLRLTLWPVVESFAAFKRITREASTNVQVVSTHSCVRNPPAADVASRGHIFIKLLTAKPN